MDRDARTDRNTRRVRALTWAGGLTLEALVFALLLAAAPTTEQTVESSSAPAEITCESVQPVSEPVV